jgi:hypothetical protein
MKQHWKWQKSEQSRKLESPARERRSSYFPTAVRKPIKEDPTIVILHDGTLKQTAPPKAPL